MKDNEDFLVCRCEEVSFKDLQKGLEQGFNSPELLKRFSRVTMGICQGRVCRSMYQEFWEHLTTESHFTKQLVEPFFSSTKDSIASLPVNKRVDLPGNRPPVRPVSVAELSEIEEE